MSMYKCPQCDRFFSSKAKVNQHVKRFHERANPPAAVTAPGDKPAEFSIKKPPAKKQAATSYHCNGCQGTVTKGQNPCPHCGESLAWENV